MKTIKITDLFQKMVEGKQLPQRIKIRNHTFDLNEETKDIEQMYEDGYLYWLRNQDKYNISLEDEVEIIEEEKEIEKIDIYDSYTNHDNLHSYINTIDEKDDKTKKFVVGAVQRETIIKLNELIDAVNELKRGN